MITVCGCEAHQTSLAKCNCMCEDHDKNFEPSVVILRKAIRELSDRLWVVEDELDSSHSTFTALAARATFAEGRDLPPDVWDRFGTRWSAVRVNNDLLWEGRGRRRTLEKVDEHYGPLTPTSPLAEDQEPLPDAGKDKDVEPCPKCGHYRDTPNHELGCEPKESDGDLLARLGTDATKWAEEFVATFLGHTIGPRSKVDVGLMLAWFASAIEAGRMSVESPALETQRVRAARQALIDTGYFNEEQVGDDAAPRIIELAAKFADTIRERDEARRDVARLTSELSLHAKNTAPEPEALTGVVRPPEPFICHAAIGPMEVGSICEHCGHHSLADAEDGPCMICFLEAKFA